MQFNAKARYIRISPFKLRPLADVVRGKSVQWALSMLATVSVKKADPITKLIESAAANAKYLNNLDHAGLVVDTIFVDHGPSLKYFKPGAMGRSNPQTKRLSHVSVVLKPIDTVVKEA